MEKILLNGLTMLSRERAHDEIAHALALPQWYGRNLDALWDMVSTLHADVLLTDCDAMLAALGDYGEKLIATLWEASEENPNFSFETRA